MWLIKWAPPLLIVILSLSCKPPQQVKFVVPIFKLRPPPSYLFEDERDIYILCHNIKHKLDEQKCQQCGANFSLPAKINCWFCHATGKCIVCSIFELEGKCRFCNSTGYLPDGTLCPACHGTGLCHLCHGTQKCDICNETGTITTKTKLHSPKPPGEKKTYAPQPDRIILSHYIAKPDNKIKVEVDIKSQRISEVNVRIYKFDVDFKRLVFQTKSPIFECGPFKPGSYLLVAQADGIKLVSGFDVVSIDKISCQHYPRVEQMPPVSLNLNETNFVGDGDKLKFSITTNPPVREEFINWFIVAEDKRKKFATGREAEISSYERDFKIEVQIINQPWSVAFEVGEFKYIMQSLIKFLEREEKVVIKGETISCQAIYQPQPVETKAVEWYILAHQENAFPVLISNESTEAGFVRFRVDIDKPFSIFFKSRNYVSQPVAFSVVSVFFVDINNQNKEHIRFAYFENCFDIMGNPRDDFPFSDEEVFKIAIGGIPEDPDPHVFVRTVDANGKEINPWVKYSLKKQESSDKTLYLTKPLIIVSDEMDDKHELMGIKDDQPDDPSIIATPGSFLEVKYKNMRVSKQLIAPPENFIPLSKPLNINLNFHITGKNKDIEQNIKKVVDLTNKIWARAFINFNINRIDFVSEPSNILFISDNADGGYHKFYLDGKEIVIPTSFGDAPLKTARAIVEKIKDRYICKIVEGWFMDTVSVVIWRKDKKIPDVSVSPEIGDIRQKLKQMPFKAEDGCELSYKEDGLSEEEAILLYTLGDSDPSTIDVFVVAEYKNKQKSSIIRGFPLSVFPKDIANSIFITTRALEPEGSNLFAFPAEITRLLTLKSYNLRPPSILHTRQSNYNSIYAYKRLLHDDLLAFFKNWYTKEEFAKMLKEE